MSPGVLNGGDQKLRDSRVQKRDNPRMGHAWDTKDTQYGRNGGNLAWMSELESKIRVRVLTQAYQASCVSSWYVTVTEG